MIYHTSFQLNWINSTDYRCQHYRLSFELVTKSYKPRFLEYRDSQKLYKSVVRGVQLKFFLKNSDEYLGGHGASDFCHDRVIADGHKLLDKKLLFGSFEKYFHLAATFVQRSNCQVRQTYVVEQENQILLGFGLFLPDMTQVLEAFFGNVASF